MKDSNWVVSLYETFMMRDLVGYAGPGSILIVGLLCELGQTKFLMSIISTWSGILLLVVASYIAAIGLRLLGTSFRLVVFHRELGVFGRARRTDVRDDGIRKIERFLWRRPESWLRGVYARIPKERRESVYNREQVFMHVTGLTGTAFLVFAVAVYFLDHNGLSQLLSISERTIVIALVLASIVFLLGHYRNAHHVEVLRKLGSRST
jgi:protein-S-isoprenylcysteine O-methyltransferase Ste14